MDWTWGITIAAIIGAIANIYKLWWGFAIWLVTNITWVIVDIQAGLYAQAFLFGVYALLALWGLIQWVKEGD